MTDTPELTPAQQQELTEAIEALGREHLGEDGWWKDPTWRITRTVRHYLALGIPMSRIIDMIDTGISIGREQYGG